MITLNGRLIGLTLKQNTGNAPIDGVELDLSTYIISLGDISWSADSNLTKLSLGDFSVLIADNESNTVWNFIDNSLASTSGILPPWLILTVDGIQRFIGLVKESPIRNEDASTSEITINAISWSSMLEDQRISQDDLAFSRLNTFRNGDARMASIPISCQSTTGKELRKGINKNLVILPIEQERNFAVNDWVYFANYNGWTTYNKVYQIQATKTLNIAGLGNKLCVYLGSGFFWQEGKLGDTEATRQQSSINTVMCVNRGVYSDTPYLPKFTVAETRLGGGSTTMKLTYVDGLKPGDILDKIINVALPDDPSISCKIVDIDPVSNTVFLSEALGEDVIANTTTFEINAESLREAILLPIKPLVERALLGLATTDYSSYAPTLLPSPCFSFISPQSPSNQNVHTETLSGSRDIQAAISSFEVQGSNGAAWTGTPSEGWDALGSWTKTVSWTDQQTTAPAYLMPYVAFPLDGEVGTRYDRDSTDFPGLFGSFSPNRDDFSLYNSAYPAYKYVYDYSNYRLYTLRYYNSVLTTTVQHYVTGAWWNVPGFDFSGVGLPCDMVPFSDVSSAVGSGYGLLAIYKNGTIKTILSNVSLTASLAGRDVLDEKGKLQTHLKQTHNGVYYLTPTGYGKIEVVNGNLTSKWVQIISTNTREGIQRITPITSTWTYANGRIITLAKFSYKENAKVDTQVIDSTYILQLKPEIGSRATDTIISVDFICNNVPRACMAVKSPISEDILGLLGNRLFSVTRYIPETIERFNPLNQTAQAIIEFVCSATNTIAVPLVSGGVVKLITRGYQTTPVNINVDQISYQDSKWNQNLASCIVVEGEDDKKGVAVSTSQLAGMTISLSNKVYIRNSSQAQAIAESYLDFFEKPRHEVVQEWFSMSTPAPWETLEPMSIITINGGSTQYYLTSLSHNLERMTASATLLEVV